MCRVLGVLALLGMVSMAEVLCPPVPPPRVVDRDVVDQNGVVIERDHYADPGPPPPARDEVVPVGPFVGAVWVGGHWFWGRGRRWVWVPGYWR